jgi:hypothetical protein
LLDLPLSDTSGPHDRGLCLGLASRPELEPSRAVSPRRSCPGPDAFGGPTGDDPRWQRAGSAWKTVAPELRFTEERVRVRGVEDPQRRGRTRFLPTGKPGGILARNW